MHFFDESGTVDYFCIIHPHMIGKVIVNPLRVETIKKLKVTGEMREL